MRSIRIWACSEDEGQKVLEECGRDIEPGQKRDCLSVTERLPGREIAVKTLPYWNSLEQVRPSTRGHEIQTLCHREPFEIVH